MMIRTGALIALRLGDAGITRLVISVFTPASLIPISCSEMHYAHPYAVHH
jgi:hypothetical protein